jgi:copper transporter 1
MLLNWNTIDDYFLSSSIHTRSSFVFFIACLGSFLLVISLEFLRRLQREFDRYLRARQSLLEGKEYTTPGEMEETLLQKGVDENGVVVKRKDRI